MQNFRHYHLLTILNTFDTSTLPLDVFLSKFFRAHKSLGSKDRSYICETLYTLIRWKGLLDYLCEKPLTWEKRLQALETLNLEEIKKDSTIPLHIRVSFPKFFVDKLLKFFGEQKTMDFCLTSNLSAPTTIRINPLKTTRDFLLTQWKEKYPIFPCEHSEYGIVFKKRVNFFELQEFKEGLFELQDEGSQIVATHMQPKPGQHVLDFCAGSGGKTLAFAHLMEKKGQIYLYDIRNHALLQAKKRLKRAGIQNAQFLDKEKLKKKGLLQRMDWVLLDVPCSGSGTLRRNPDMKWRFDPEMVDRLVIQQREIFDQAIKYLAPQGKIVYATCSVLPEENQEQIGYFLKKYSLKLADLPFFTFPQQDGMDGFFAAVLTRS
jgi:16S rRNA (cytosine(967)-C(5))-methyltransferase